MLPNISPTAILLVIFSLPLSYLQAQDKPDWVINAPENELYYTGVGTSQKEYDNSHVAKARSMALNEIASQISINISTESVLSMIEENQNVDETFEEQTVTNISQELKFYEKVDSWENEYQYWVYYRLSKMQYKQWQMERKEKALQLSKDLFVQGQEQEELGNLMRAVSFYARGLDALKDFLNESGKVIINDREILLSNELFSRIQNIMLKTELKIDALPHELKPFNDLNTSLAVKVEYADADNNKNISIHNGLVRFQVENNSIELDSLVNTNNNGVAEARLTRINSSQRNQIVEAKLQLLPRQEYTALSQVIRRLLSSVPRPSISIQLDVEPLSVFVSSITLVDGEEKQSGISTSVLSQSLADQGVIVAFRKEKADYHIELQARVRRGGDSIGLKSAYTDLNIILKENNGDILNRLSVRNVKGFKPSMEQAVDRSIINAVNKMLENGLIDQVLNPSVQ